MSFISKSGSVGVTRDSNELSVDIMEGEKILRIPKALIYSIEQVREDFDEEKLYELSMSLEEHGQLQPIVVLPVDKTQKYQLHQGERRWRAAKMNSKITHLDCIIRKEGTIFQQLAENIQRENLNAIEMSRSILKLKKSHNYNSNDIADKLAVSKSYVSMYENVSKAPGFILDAYRKQKIADVTTLNLLRVSL